MRGNKAKDECGKLEVEKFGIEQLMSTNIILMLRFSLLYQVTLLTECDIWSAAKVFLNHKYSIIKFCPMNGDDFLEIGIMQVFSRSSYFCRRFW